MFWENIKLALKSMWANKMRTILSLLGIVIGVASVVAILNLGNSATKSITGSLEAGGLDTISITSMNSKHSEVFDELLGDSLIKNVPGIDKVLCVNNSSSRIRNKKKISSGSIYGVDSSYAQEMELSLEYGNFFSAEDNITTRQVVVLGHSLAETLFPNESAVGQYISIFRQQSKRYLVVGVLDKKEASLTGSYDNSAFIPYNTYTQRFLRTSRVGTYIVKITSGYDSLEVSDDISDYLDNLAGSNSYSIYSAANLNEIASEISGTFSTFLAAIAGISLVVGGIGIMNIMLVSVAERTKEIGIRKALGAAPKVIRGQFITEAIVLTLTGGIIGLLIGTGVSRIIVNIAGWELSPSLNSYVISIGFSMLIGVFFGWYPAKKASKLDPIEALNYE